LQKQVKKIFPVKLFFSLYIVLIFKKISYRQGTKEWCNTKAPTFKADAFDKLFE